MIFPVDVRLRVRTYYNHAVFRGGLIERLSQPALWLRRRKGGPPVQSNGDCKLPLDKVLTAEDRKMRLPWWGVLCVMLGALPLALLFGYFGRFDLARPSLFSVGMLAIAIAMRWKLRRHVWFWVTMAFLAALHLPFILFIPWTTKWIPAFVLIPFGMADLYAMLWTVYFVGKFMGEPAAPPGKSPRSRKSPSRSSGVN
jgi:hypothetical protein